MAQDSIRKLGWLPTFGVLILAALPRLTSLGAFLANDETLYWEWSHDFFHALLHGDGLGTIVGPGNPSITLFWSHTLVMGAKYAWAWFNGIQATALATWPDFQPEPVLDLLVQRRLPIVIFNTLAVVLAYRLVRLLYGPWIALVAAILLALDPFYLADSRTSRGEGLMSSLVILVILWYLAYWLFRRRRYLIFSGIMAGLAMLTKVSALSLVIWVVLATPLLALASLNKIQAWPYLFSKPMLALLLSKEQLKWMFAIGLTWGLCAVATFWALWPAMWVAPVQALGFVAAFVSDVGVSGRQNYFFNQVYTDELLPLFYPVVFILRVTPLTCLGLLATVSYLWQADSKSSALLAHPNRAEEASAILAKSPPSLAGLEHLQPLLTILLGLFVLIYGALMTVGTLKRDWYILPVFPALDIMAAVGLVRLGQWVGQRWAGRVTPLLAGVGGLMAVLLLQAITVLPSHPYYYTYWNPLVLGERWAADAVRVGWDLDLSAGADYLNRKPNAETLRAATRSTRGFQQIFKGQTIRWVPEQPWIQADYLLVRRNHLQREKVDAYLLNYVSHLKLDHVVTIEGVDYLWIYEGPRAQYFAGPSTLAGKAMLMGYNLYPSDPTLNSSTSNLEPPILAAGDTLFAKFYWQNQGMTPADDLFLQLVDANNYIWAEVVVTPLPGFAEAALTNQQLVESQVALLVPIGTPPGDYFLRSGVYNRARQETLGYFTLATGGDKVTVTRPAGAPAAADVPIAQRLETKLSPQMSLLGFDLPDAMLQLSHPTWLTLYWQTQAGAAVGRDYVVAVQLLNPQGKEAAYWLGRPVLSGYPTTDWAAGEIVRDPWQLELPADVPPGDYTLQVALFDAETQAQTGQTKLGAVSVVKRPQHFDVPALPNIVNASLGDQITLLGYDLSTEPITGGGRLRLTLYWQTQQALPTSYTVFVHLLDPSDHVVAQQDSIPAEGAIPTSDWAVNEVIADRHLIEFPDLPTGEYRLIVGMYDPATGERLLASGGDTSISLQTIPMD
jgi:uncharacterized membrane protein